MERYDVAIIGAGPGGYVAAIYAARLGKSVAVIEKDLLGGTCLNRGCIPTKALLQSAQLLTHIKEAPAFGIEVNPPKLNFEKVNSRKDEVVKKLRLGIESLFKARKVHLFHAHAKLIDDHTIEFDSKKIEAGSIIIATGSRPLETPLFKFNHKNILSSDDILEMKKVPESLTIIGGGAVGCEFAAIYNTFGSKVTIIEMMDEILPATDKEIAKRLSLILKKKGIEILTSEKVEALKEGHGKVEAILSSGKTIESEKILVCIGRRPNVEGLGLEALKIKLEKGRIAVDEHMRTTAPDVYAIGDVAGKFQLAHVASYEGIVACDNICGGEKSADYKSVPNCVYTDPEVASVGFSEAKCKEMGYEIKIARFPFASLGKAHVIGKTEGMIKLVGEKDTGYVLGVHIIGAEATNLIAEAALAMKQRLKIEEVADTIHAHPTFPEAIMEACHIFSEKGIHTL